jgi:elongation factor Ts
VKKPKTAGKPQEIVEKMLQGQMDKYLAEICLVGQPFIKDQDKTVSQLLKEKASDIFAMNRFAVGEGIEVIKKSFQEEVMQQVKGS